MHLHTQFNRELPWSTIDMDFMNLNQSAHGDREFGFIGSRMRLNRKVIVGYWQEGDLHSELATWIRAAIAWNDAQWLKVARFGANMRFYQQNNQGGSAASQSLVPSISLSASLRPPDTTFNLPAVAAGGTLGINSGGGSTFSAPLTSGGAIDAGFLSYGEAHTISVKYQ